MLFIPILKYPVLIWFILDFSMSNNAICLALGSFFIMITMDIFQKELIGIRGILIKVTLLIVTGILILHPWIEQKNQLLDVTLIALPLVFLLFDRIKKIPFFPVIFYPIAHIIDLLF